MHRDDRERYSRYWGDDVGQRSPDERGYEAYRGGGEHVGGFYGQESSFGREAHDREQDRERAGRDYDRRAYGDEAGGAHRGPGRREFGGGGGGRYGEGEPRRYDRWAGPERGRQGYPGSMEERFGPGAYDREPDRRYGQDRGREYGERGFEQGGYGFQSPEQRAYDQGRSRGRGYDDGRYGRGFYDRERRPDQDFGGPARGGRDWSERPNQYGQPDYARDLGHLNQGWRDTWRGGTSYAGRGPRNYRRSDDRIRDDVCEVLTRHPEIDASDIEVDVRDGEVTLRGMVDSRRTRRLAEDAIEDLPGVRDVHNQLRSADRMRGSEGDPSRSGASGSDTGKVEVTGDESGSPHATPSAHDAAPGSTPLGHTYEGTGTGTGGMTSGEVDNQAWRTSNLMGTDPGTQDSRSHRGR